MGCFFQPLLITEAKGAKIYDHRGHEYLDFYNNVHQVTHVEWSGMFFKQRTQHVPQIGHGDSRVVEAVADQMSKSCLSTRFLNEVTPR